MSEDEIIERLNNLEVKISNYEKLSDDEALDIVFLPMFASEDSACGITEKVTRLFHRDKSLTGAFRGDIAYGLSIMIRKYFDLTDKGKELLNLINPIVYTSNIKDVIEFEVDYATKSLEKEISDRDESIRHKDEDIRLKEVDIRHKDDEIKSLKAILEKNGIEYE